MPTFFIVRHAGPTGRLSLCASGGRRSHNIACLSHPGDPRPVRAYIRGVTLRPDRPPRRRLGGLVRLRGGGPELHPQDPYEANERPGTDRRRLRISRQPWLPDRTGSARRRRKPLTRGAGKQPTDLCHDLIQFSGGFTERAAVKASGLAHGRASLQPRDAGGGPEGPARRQGCVPEGRRPRGTARDRARIEPASSRAARPEGAMRRASARCATAPHRRGLAPCSVSVRS